ncbi:hypothetical protein PHYSODRAFT_334540 [Phytophthora sojae]|uniref:MULE transposase domain-containing protein n=1 Tax=Phytophthora sojae (strain P6497) TaxID=1094619 RepID=G4ZPU6_PHYSP|nr:hypothetical protein PHYSODRAFT_334540 [Phytophthora sojae]EGZ16351.1 hypothetical protein PHYSODRAFT_334540 [Phytophthora sojae]|eukprot:XP_009530100.1 hypothetical protein PHYSODRAFT_334540 [Phytophthora sojae]
MESERLQRVLGWADPRLLELLRYLGSQMFVDGTFRCVPRSFYQCVVLMVSDAASGVFVPSVYTLTTGKTHQLYQKLMRFMNDCTGSRLQPGSVVCDFEAALIDSVTDQFPHARVIGCLFHFKQVIRRRMMKLRIRPQEISIAMEVGVLDMLTVIVPAHVDPHGINYVSELIMSRCRTEEIEYSAVEWDRFWKYFRRTWINIFPVDVWNVYGMDLGVVSRTNNPLERFNRELNAAICDGVSIPKFG